MTQKQVKRIGVLTSGGDAPGMNAVIRAVVRTASSQGVSVLGIRRGYSGLISGDLVELTRRSVDGLLNRGGTMLYTARCMEMFTEEGQEKAALTCRHMGLQGLAVIGGDGSFRGALALSQRGLAVVGIPATIDNDICCTDYSIGFDTACNTAIDAIDKLRDTMQSHERCSVVEVMGREAGHLALNVGVGVGATCILLPERHVDFEHAVIEPIRMGRLSGRNHHLIIVAEGHSSAQDVAVKVQESTGMDARVTILGHIQRGGQPSAQDRVIGTQMGCHAANLLLAGKKPTRLVISKDGDVVDCDMEEGLAQKKDLSQSLFEAALAVTK
ncbi:MAG: 6-phosphofructokinase [Oscillospiraceae bacterium]|nr:6-phosphofructokinase [Oscillospiraceae bacterium]